MQPVDPLNEWVTPPYSADVRDGAIYGRGVADNKNGLASKICAVDAFLKVYGKLPVNVKFIVEGEEEIGSPNLEVFAKAHPELLACDGYNWEGGVKERASPHRYTSAPRAFCMWSWNARAPRQIHTPAMPLLSQIRHGAWCGR